MEIYAADTRKSADLKIAGKISRLLEKPVVTIGGSVRGSVDGFHGDWDLVALQRRLKWVSYWRRKS